MKVLVTGATGLVGSRLAAALSARGDRVVAVTRQHDFARPDGRLARAFDELRVPGLVGTHVMTDMTRSDRWASVTKDVDAVVHLAGAGVFDRRWSEAYKRTIRDSRVETTAALAAALAANPRRADGTPRTFVSASAVGYYGPGDDECDESAPPGRDFLARVCVDWEAAADPARAAGVRVVHPRIGVVLDPTGGALPQIVRPFRWFVGGPIAPGTQWVSWIHRDDMTAVLMHILDSPAMTGPVNAVAPWAEQNRDFCRKVGAVLHRPSWLPVPRVVIRLAIGEVAYVTCTGQYAVPRKLRDAGFTWRFPDLAPALRDLLGRPDLPL